VLNFVESTDDGWNSAAGRLLGCTHLIHVGCDAVCWRTSPQHHWTRSEQPSAPSPFWFHVVREHSYVVQLLRTGKKLYDFI